MSEYINDKNYSWTQYVFIENLKKSLQSVHILNLTLQEIRTEIEHMLTPILDAKHGKESRIHMLLQGLSLVSTNIWDATYIIFMW
jgi:hypothetical protein